MFVPSFLRTPLGTAFSMTFNGSGSYASVTLDRTKFAFGDSGGLEFRTRQSTSTLLLLQFLSLDGLVDKFVEFRLYQGRVQVYSSFSQGGSRELSLRLPYGTVKVT